MSIDLTDRSRDGLVDERFQSPPSSDDKRKTILAAARECIAESGLDGTSIAKIARRAGVSKSLVLYHFGTKQSLAAAAWETALADVGIRLHPSWALSRASIAWKLTFE
ncbi:TetR/AcrR family transcriptional regulator [Pseudorhodoplanes sp.]|uniref:TetR/AcrR family transcriptional regulator n=1 Tax=Pseudorhodoplanes sp. TaxID=1934341 RepID=UPI003D14F7D2